VIKGLLKQPYPEFNVLEAWRALVDPEMDSLLEWSREDAAVLKDKLEFRKGTPRDLAFEARSLARPAGRNVNTEMDEPAWNEGSPMTSQVMSRSASAVGKTWPEHSSLSSSIASTSKLIPQAPHYQSDANWKGEAAWLRGFTQNVDRILASDLEMREVIAESYI
jgi:hypothetical protein